MKNLKDRIMEGMDVKVVVGHKSVGFRSYVQQNTTNFKVGIVKFNNYVNIVDKRINSLNIAHQKDVVEFFDALEMCILFDAASLPNNLLVDYTRFVNSSTVDYKLIRNGDINSFDCQIKG